MNFSVSILVRVFADDILKHVDIFYLCVVSKNPRNPLHRSRRRPIILPVGRNQ